jgi:hypothetical protein
MEIPTFEELIQSLEIADQIDATPENQELEKALALLDKEIAEAATDEEDE